MSENPASENPASENPASENPASENHPPTPSQPTRDDFLRVAQNPRFGELRGRFRRFAFPMTVFFIAWYLLYVLLSCYAGGLMSQRIAGTAITVGLVLGGLQFVTTFGITWLYIRHANRSLDPAVAELRADLENSSFSHEGGRA